MPGILGFLLKSPADKEINKKQLESMAEAQTHQNHHLIDTFVASQMSLGRISLGVINKKCQPVISCDDRYYLFMDGQIDNPEELLRFMPNKTTKRNISDEEIIINVFPKLKTMLPQHLKGVFNIAIYDKREGLLYLFCDRYGVYPLYYTRTANGFYFSPEIKALLLIPGIKKALDKRALVNFLTLGHFIGEETFFENIKLFPYGTQFVIKTNGDVENIKYWDYPVSFNYQNFSNADDFVGEGTERLRQAISKYFKSPNHKVGITLSGGLDSRTICAFSTKITSNLSCFHVKLTEREAKIANTVCKRLGGKWHLSDFNNLNWHKLLKEGSYLTDGHLNCSQFWMMSILPYINDIDYLLDGAVIDLTYELTERYPLDDNQYGEIIKNNTIGNYDDAFSFIMKVYSPLPKAYISRFLSDSFSTEMEIFRENVISHLKRFETNDIGGLAQYFYFTSRGRRFVWPTPLISRNIAEVGFPGFDYDLFDYGVSLPIHLRMEANLYRRIIFNAFSELRDIPWAKTGLPITHYKTIFSKIKSQIKFYNYYVMKVTKGKFSFQKSTLDLDHKFRVDYKFRQPFVDILLDKRAANRGHVERINIEQLLKYHDAGENLFSLIQRLVTVEMFFRHFME